MQRWPGYLNLTLCLLLTLLMASGEWSELCAAQNPPSSAPTIKKLNLVIVEGDGAVNNVRQRVAREVIVQVDDENDRPIAGAAVLFLLPRGGAGGSFTNATNSFSVTTNATGRAVASFTPNTVEGSFQINVTATFQGQTATVVIRQNNGTGTSGSGANPTAPIVPARSKGVSGKTVAFVALAAVAAVAVGLVMNKKDVTTASQNPTIRIGVSGPPIAGAPGNFAQSNRENSPRLK